jgi:hypothetical protein
VKPLRILVNNRPMYASADLRFVADSKVELAAKAADRMYTKTPRRES